MQVVRVVEVEPVGGYRIRLRFEDGAEGSVDVSTLIPFANDYERLRDPDFFRQVAIEKEFGSIVWPGDLDVDPYTLYAEATGKELRLNDGSVIRPSGVPSR